MYMIWTETVMDTLANKNHFIENLKTFSITLLFLLWAVSSMVVLYWYIDGLAEKNKASNPSPNSPSRQSDYRINPGLDEGCIYGDGNGFACQ